MSNSTGNPWSNNPNAPQVTHLVYFGEKENFAGILIGAILYGIIIALFFQCMGALLGPVSLRRRAVKWGLVAHTVTMFLVVTVYNATSLYNQSISYIDNRGFPGGPLLYQLSITTTAISFLPNIMFLLNNWLADGLLLYRCHVVYFMNYWAIAFPCLMYIATVAMGILFTIQTAKPAFFTYHDTGGIDAGVSYYTISFSLNVLLTVMIVARLILHRRNARNSAGSHARASGLYDAIIAMLIESSALYAVTFLSYIVPWSFKLGSEFIFFPILAGTQVIGPFLITLRVANQRTSTNETVVSGHLGSLHFKSQGETIGDETLHDEYPMDPMDSNRETSGGRSSGVETTIDFRLDIDET